MCTPEALAQTLRKAAEGAISEGEFWEQLRTWSSSGDDPRIAIAWEQAEHYWSNFHQRNIFLFRVKPDPNQVQQGKEALLLLAMALEEGWTEEQIERELHNI